MDLASSIVAEILHRENMACEADKDDTPEVSDGSHVKSGGESDPSFEQIGV